MSFSTVPNLAGSGGRLMAVAGTVVAGVDGWLVYVVMATEGTAAVSTTVL